TGQESPGRALRWMASDDALSAPDTWRRARLRRLQLPAEEAARLNSACGLLVIVLETHARPYTAQPWGWLPSYGAAARLTRRSFRRLATRARRLPRLRAVVSSASTGCRDPSVPARVLGP